MYTPLLKFYLGRNGRMRKCQHDVLHNPYRNFFFFLFFLISIFHFSWHTENIIHRDEWIALHSCLNGLKRHTPRQMAIPVCLLCTCRSYKQKHLKNVTIFPSKEYQWTRLSFSFKKLIAFSIIACQFYSRFSSINPDANIIINLWKPRKIVFFFLLKVILTAHFPLNSWILGRTVYIKIPSHNPRRNN